MDTRSILKKFPDRFQGSYAIFHSQQPYVREPVSLLLTVIILVFIFFCVSGCLNFLSTVHLFKKRKPHTVDKSHRSLKHAVYYVHNQFDPCSSLLPYTVRFPILLLGVTARVGWGFQLTTTPLLNLGCFFRYLHLLNEVRVLEGAGTLNLHCASSES